MRNSLHRFFLSLPLVPLLYACEAAPKLTHLETVQARGTLIVGTRNAGTTYYHRAQGPMGLEYQPAKGFATYLGVKLEMRVP